MPETRRFILGVCAARIGRAIVGLALLGLFFALATGRVESTAAARVSLAVGVLGQVVIRLAFRLPNSSLESAMRLARRMESPCTAIMFAGIATIAPLLPTLAFRRCLFAVDPFAMLVDQMFWPLTVAGAVYGLYGWFAHPRDSLGILFVISGGIVGLLGFGQLKPSGNLFVGGAMAVAFVPLVSVTRWILARECRALCAIDEWPSLGGDERPMPLDASNGARRR